MISVPSLTIHHYIPMPNLISDGIFLVLILEDWQIDLQVASMLPVVSAMVHILIAPRSPGMQ